MGELEVYLSLSMNVSDSIRDEIISNLSKVSQIYNIKYWQKGIKYTTDQLLTSDALVVYVDGNKFNSSNLTRGVNSEVALARQEEIPIFLAYKTATGSWGFYEINEDSWDDDNSLRAIAGTAKSIHSLTERHNKLNRKISFSEKFSKQEIEYSKRDSQNLKDVETLRKNPLTYDEATRSNPKLILLKRKK